MTPTLAALLAIILGLPVLAFIAVVLAVGANQSLITGGLTFFVVIAAVTAMIFEIKRLVDQGASEH